MSKSCATCRFSSEERPQAGMLVPVLICRYGPPQAVLVPMANARGEVQGQIRAMMPAVAANDWCHRHEPLPSVNN